MVLFYKKKMTAAKFIAAIFLVCHAFPRNGCGGDKMRIFLLITKTTGFPSLLYWVTVEAPAKVEIGTSGFSRKPSTNLRGVRVCQLTN